MYILMTSPMMDKTCFTKSLTMIALIDRPVLLEMLPSNLLSRCTSWFHRTQLQSITCIKHIGNEAMQYMYLFRHTTRWNIVTQLQMSATQIVLPRCMPSRAVSDTARLTKERELQWALVHWNCWSGCVGDEIVNMYMAHFRQWDRLHHACVGKPNCQFTLWCG